MRKEVSLLEACDFIRDGTHSSPERTPTGIPVLSAEHVIDGGLSFDTARFTSLRELEIFHRRLHPCPGDVLLTIVGTIGRVGVVRDVRPFVFQRSVCVFRPKSGVLDSRYLQYCLRSAYVQRQLTKETREVAQAGVYLEALNEIRIPYIPLSAQQLIANRLDACDALCLTRRLALQLCDDFLPAAFFEMFGRSTTAWPTVSVEKLAANEPNSVRTGPFGSQLLHSEFTSTGVAVLGIDNAVNNRFEWAERRYISPQKHAQLKRYTVRPGDVIITIMGTCGRCAVVPSDIPLAINTKHLCCITLDRTRALPEFLHAAFLFQPSIRRQLGASQKGAIMDGLNMEIIKGLTLPLPPIHLQRRFVALVQEQSGLRAAHVEALRQADHLFQTLLQEAFVQ